MKKNSYKNKVKRLQVRKVLWSKRIRYVARSALRHLALRVRDAKNLGITPNAYYITLGPGIALLDMKPYYGWRNAYKYAKAKHSKAFIIKGSKLIFIIEKQKFAAAKSAWRGYGA